MSHYVPLGNFISNHSIYRKLSSMNCYADLSKWKDDPIALKKCNVYQNSPFRIRLRRLYAPMHKTLLGDVDWCFSGNHRLLKTQSTKQTVQSQIESSCLVDINLADGLKNWFKTNDFMLNLAFSFWNLFTIFRVHVKQVLLALSVHM